MDLDYENQNNITNILKFCWSLHSWC